MKNQNTIELIMQSQFGFGVDEALEKSSDTGIRKKFAQYLEMEKEMRSMEYGRAIQESSMMASRMISFVQDAVELGNFVVSVSEIPDAYDRKIKDYFSQYFPTFDKNASIALGQRFKRAFNYLSEKPGALLQEGEAKHLSNMIMANIEKSQNSFFRKLSRNYEMRISFQKRLDVYCGLVWRIAMQHSGNFSNGITERIEDEKREEPILKLRQAQ